MSFEQASSYLDGLGTDAMRAAPPSLARIQALCDALDNPERSISSIHIAGTNGKTSTARLAASILAATGLSVGTYTSPHLQTVRERISLSGRPLSEEAFGEVFDHLRPYLEMVESGLGERLSYFEVLTAMFFLWAAESVDAAVVETGLGGRWDATNVMSSSVCVVTNVGLDHTDILGEDRESIAREKAGIVKPGSVLVTGERAPDVLAVLAKEAALNGAELSVMERDFGVTEDRVALGGRYLSGRVASQEYEGLFLPLHGVHQAHNAAVALEAVARFLPAAPERELVQQGLSAVEVPGRLEVVRAAGGPAAVVLDVAHNPDGAAALVAGLAEAFAFGRVGFVIGVLEDKDLDGILGELSRLPCSLVATQARTSRAVPADEVRAVAEGLGLECTVADDVAGAVDLAVGATSEIELVCVTGSHYVVGEARSHLLEGSAE